MSMTKINECTPRISFCTLRSLASIFMCNRILRGNLIKEGEKQRKYGSVNECKVRVCEYKLRFFR